MAEDAAHDEVAPHEAEEFAAAEEAETMAAPWGGSTALFETVTRGNLRMAMGFEDPQKEEETWAEFFARMGRQGGDAIANTGGAIASTGGTITSGLADFFKSLSILGAKTDPGAPKEAKPQEGMLGVSFQKYPLANYVKLPVVLQPFLNLPVLDHYLIVGRPTADKSGGLELYRQSCPKEMRAAAPFLIVIDDPGKLEAGYKDPKGYIWVEMKLVDVFKLDVAAMGRWPDDYAAALSKKGRWNLKDRLKKFAASPLVLEYRELPLGATEIVDELWPLYHATGERNGFCVLEERPFYKFHTRTPGLTLLTIRDSSQGGRLVTFCTGVRDGDTLMPQWCGTDYSNELSRKCSTYFIMLYEFFRQAIEMPGINWVDLGASRRSVKEGLGCKGHPVSAYIRCKHEVGRSVVETFAATYFKPEQFINDP